MESDRVSIIISACNEGDNLLDTVRCILTNTLHLKFEIIVVDDGSTDGSGDKTAACFANDSRVMVKKAAGLGVAGGRNLGAQAAEGEVLVFLDGHTYTPPGWIADLIKPLENPQTGMAGPVFASLNETKGPRGYGGTWRGLSLEMDWLPYRGTESYAVPILPGGCQAIRRGVFEEICGYDSGMTKWGSEDLEISLRTWLMGYDCILQPNAVVYHLFRNRHPYHVEVPEVMYNRLRMALLHFSDARAARVIEYYRGIAEFGQIMLRLLDSDVTHVRRELVKLRRRDDDWYFRRFGLKTMG